MGQLANARTGEGSAACAGSQHVEGKRDYATLVLLVVCALRRRELAVLYIADVQQREGRWVIADLHGKGNRIRTVAVPLWVKAAIDARLAEGELLKGRIFRSVAKNGTISRSSLSDWAVWSIVQQSAEEIGMKRSVRTISDGLAQSSVVNPVAIWSRSSSYLITLRFRRPNAISAPSRTLQLRSMTTWACSSGLTDHKAFARQQDRFGRDRRDVVRVENPLNLR